MKMPGHNKRSARRSKSTEPEPKLNEESVVKDVAADVNNVELDTRKDDGRLEDHHVFDICQKSLIKLEAPPIDVQDNQPLMKGENIIIQKSLIKLEAPPLDVQDNQPLMKGENLIIQKSLIELEAPPLDVQDNQPLMKAENIIIQKSLTELEAPPLDVQDNQPLMKGENIIILEQGMVLLKGYISLDDQISVVRTCRELGIGDGGFYQPTHKGGGKLNFHMMCLGKNWDPRSYKYTDIRSFDQSTPPPIPESFHDIVQKAILDSNDYIRETIGGSDDERKLIPSMSPDICVVNFYSEGGKLGLHQDKDESKASLKKGLPVVSFSIGDSAEFLYGRSGNVNRTNKVILESGDILIFGGKSRLIYHGVQSIHPATAPIPLTEATDMLPGRLNLTFRMY